MIARSVHPLPGEAERKERLLALVDGFSSRRVLVVGDLIADEFIYGEVARVSREAPVLILKYDATEMVRRRRRQRGQQRRGARRPRACWPASSGATPKGGGCSRAFRAASIDAHVVRARRLPDAGQDAHPRRRRPLREAAGRAHRSRDRLAARPRRSSRAFATKLSAGARRAATRSCCPTTAPAWSRRRSPDASGDALARRTRRRPVPVLRRLALSAARLSAA